MDCSKKWYQAPFGNKRHLIAFSLLFIASVAARQASQALPLIQRGADGIIRIGIKNKASEITIEPDAPLTMVDMTTGQRISLEPSGHYRITPSAEPGNSLFLGEQELSGQLRILSPSPDDRIRIEGKRYRGSVLILADQDNTLTAIDELGIEEYLYGVVPAEMSPTWPMEALKAQAVVSRTYAVNNMDKFRSNAFDLFSDIRSQIYEGSDKECENAVRAVKATEGQVLAYQGEILSAHFHSCCGGHTISPSEIWGKETRHIRPLRGVRDPFCEGTPHHKWDAYLPSFDLLYALQKHGWMDTRVKALRIHKRTRHGSVKTLKIYTEKGPKILNAEDLRKWLGRNYIKSAFITKITPKKKGWVIYGRGYGHGVGLCQWGTRAQAKKGRNYISILKHYFPGASVRKITHY